MTTKRWECSPESDSTVSSRSGMCCAGVVWMGRQASSLSLCCTTAFSYYHSWKKHLLPPHWLLLLTIWSHLLKPQNTNPRMCNGTLWGHYENTRRFPATNTMKWNVYCSKRWQWNASCRTPRPSNLWASSLSTTPYRVIPFDKDSSSAGITTIFFTFHVFATQILEEC